MIARLGFSPTGRRVASSPFSFSLYSNGSKKRGILDDGGGHYMLGSLLLVDGPDFR